jgi:pyridoxamine 5'-phosphate oxidase
MEPTPPSRYDYLFGELPDDEEPADPLETFQRWIDDAVAAGVVEATAMVVATVDQDGRPDARVLLLRGLDERGLRFYTNYRSAKARQLEANPTASVVAHWQPLERQVRVRGTVERLSAEESDAYFSSRPRGSQIGAWASDQSQPIEDRAALEARITAMEARFDAQDVPRPEHWGGYLLRPDVVEFWQGRPSRLHDRRRFRATADGWRTERLQP